MTNLENYEIQNTQAKMDSMLKNSKLKSKSVKNLIDKTDVKNQVVTKHHNNEEEGDPY